MKGAMSDPQSNAPSDEAFTAQVVAAFPQLEGIELIGIGGMGRVYKARQPSLDRLVALKVLPGDKADHPEWIERFTREARALARLNHPNIVRVHDFGTATIAGHTQPYLMMEFVDGVNLRQAMQAGALSAREALAIVPKLCDALHYAHEHDVLHRDIKPENVLIDSEGRVKLVDFGLAKLRDEAQAAFTLTQSGAKLGTIAYMAPEQIEKPGDVDHRADIYSLGVVFYEMLTGELPLGRFLDSMAS
jgi:serine/threonine protein kinase